MGGSLVWSTRITALKNLLKGPGEMDMLVEYFLCKLGNLILISSTHIKSSMGWGRLVNPLLERQRQGNPQAPLGQQG